MCIILCKLITHYHIIIINATTIGLCCNFLAFISLSPLIFISDVSAIRNILEETVKRLIFRVYLHHVRTEELANRLEIIMSANARQVRN
jgi:hypothetical protein